LNAIDDFQALTGLVEASFETDRQGRLVGSAPHFYLLRTRRYAIWKFHRDLPLEVTRRLEDLCRRDRGRPSQWQCEYGDYLSTVAAAGQPVAAMRAGPLYIVPADLKQNGTSLIIDDGNSFLLCKGLEEWRPDVRWCRPMLVVVEDDHAIAVCASVSATQKAHCAGVETIPEYRGRGFAAMAVAAWARAVRDLGATPFYGTTFDNISSQLVARRLQLPLVGSEFSVRCG
jgi:hypothetical protein